MEKVITAHNLKIQEIEKEVLRYLNFSYKVDLLGGGSTNIFFKSTESLVTVGYISIKKLLRESFFHIILLILKPVLAAAHVLGTTVRSTETEV